MAGRLDPLAGQVSKSGKLRVGYFAQHQADELDVGATPLIALGRLRRRANEQELRSHLGRFGFSQERADTTIEKLSGGEKARLLFALMTCDKPHILLLDEPTNHLDVLSRQALIQAINAFEGAVVIVSHDPHIVELTADRFWMVEGGRVHPYDGDLEDYRALLLSRRKGGNGVNGVKAGNGPNKKERRRAAADKRAGLASLKKKLSEAEAGGASPRGGQIEAAGRPRRLQVVQGRKRQAGLFAKAPEPGGEGPEGRRGDLGESARRMGRDAVSDERLKAEVWIMAHVRRCSADAIPAVVVRKGDSRGGTLVLKLNQFDQGCRVLSQAVDIDGKLGWMAAFSGDLVAEAEADAYIARAIARDPDLWVVEIEHPDGWHPFEGKVL